MPLEGVRGAGRLHAGLRAPPWLRRRVPHPDAQQHLAARPRAPAGRALRGRRRARRSRRHPGALRRPARADHPGQRARGRPRRRRNQQHPGAAPRARAASRCSTRRAPTPTRSRSWCSPACCWRRATSAPPGRSPAHSRATIPPSRPPSSRARRHFVGFELPGRTLGVVGLGAIGVEVANAALTLGMKVLGYDPQITVQRAWQLSVERRAGAVARGPVRARGRDHRARAAQRAHARTW